MNVFTRPSDAPGRRNAPLDIISEPKISLGGRLGDILLGKGVDSGADRFGARGRACHLHHPGPRLAAGLEAGRHRRTGAGEPVGAAAAGRRPRRPADAGAGWSGGAARPARACMCGWCCCSAASRWRRPSWWPASPWPSSISASRPGSTTRCANRWPNRCRSRAATSRSIATTSARWRWRWRTTWRGPGDSCRPIRKCSPRCWTPRPRCAA